MAERQRNVIFENVVYILDSRLGSKQARELEALLTRGGATACQTPLSGVRSLDAPSCTHVITEAADLAHDDSVRSTADFVTPRWITACYDHGILHETRFYSPDPSQIFSGVVVCTTELPGDDSDHVKAIVLAYGGQYRNALTKEVTHLVALQPQGKKYDLALKHGIKIGMRVVLPHWIWDSLRASIRVPETPFLFPDPPLFHPDRWNAQKGWLRGPSDDMEVEDEDYEPESRPLATLSGGLHDAVAAKLANESWKKYLEFASLDAEDPSQLKHLTKSLNSRVVNASEQSAEIPKFFEGLTLFFSARLNCPDALLDCICRRVERAGGYAILGKHESNALTADEQLRASDIVVCNYRAGWEFWLAFGLNKAIGNITWLIHAFACGRYSGPREHLLHFPLPVGPIPGFEHVHATLTNYTGNARELLKRIIKVMGGGFTGDLRKKARDVDGKREPATTLLIAAQLTGSKAEHAQMADMPIVNHLWLEACFIRWELVDISLDPAFTAFLPGVHYQERMESVPSLHPTDWASSTDAKRDRIICMQEHEEVLDALRPPLPRPSSPDIAVAATTETDEQAECEKSDFGSPLSSQRESGARTWARRRSELTAANTPVRQATRELTTSSAARHQSRMMSDLNSHAVVTSGLKRSAAANAAVKVSAAAVDMIHFRDEQKGSKKRARNDRRQSDSLADDDDDDDDHDQQALDAAAVPNKRRVSEANASCRKAKVSAENKTVGTIKLLETGDKLDNKIRKRLERLGVLFVDDASDCTHLCIAKAARTLKFLLAMAHHATFVNQKWAIDSAQRGHLLDESDYIVDAQTEAASQRAKTERPLFLGQAYHITTNTKVGDDARNLPALIKACGGTILPRPRRPWPSEASELDNLNIIACEADKAICRNWLEERPTLNIRTADYILEAVRQQDISEATVCWRRFGLVIYCWYLGHNFQCPLVESQKV